MRIWRMPSSCWIRPVGALEPRPLAELAQCLTGRMPDEIDWPRLVDAANQTLTTALLAQRIGPAARAPEEVLSFLAMIRARTTERNRRLIEQLDGIAAALAPLGTPPILLKGAALLVGQPWQVASARLMADIDLMLPRERLEMAVEQLLGIGYQIYRWDDAQDAPAVLCRAQDVGMVDLHCRMKGKPPDLAYREVLPHCTAVARNGHDVLLPSPALQAAVLIAHDQIQERDYWRGALDVRHLADLAELSRDPSGIDWDGLDRLFQGALGRSVLRTQLYCLRHLLGVAVPDHLCSGGGPRLQYLRRIAQARWRWLRFPFTTMAFAWTLASMLVPSPRRSAKSCNYSFDKMLTIKMYMKCNRPLQVGKY